MLKSCLFIEHFPPACETWTAPNPSPKPCPAQLAQVKKISPFEGVFSLGEDVEAVAAEPLQELLALLDGFCIEAKGPEVVQSLGRGVEMWRMWCELLECSKS